MPKSTRTWVIVADGAVARLFVPNDEETALVEGKLPGLHASELHAHARDVNSDHPGRSVSSDGGGMRHAIEPRHDPHKMEKHKFTAAVAKALDEACEARAFDQLVLVAPNRSVGEFRTLLPERVQARLGQVIAKDLTKATAAELWPKVAHAVRNPAPAQTK
jgi:protein required for attachment to host cells